MGRKQGHKDEHEHWIGTEESLPVCIMYVIPPCPVALAIPLLQFLLDPADEKNI